MRIITRKSDLLNDVDGRFDLIIANPPHLVNPLMRKQRHGGGTLGSELSIVMVDVAAVSASPLVEHCFSTLGPQLLMEKIYFEKSKKN